MRGASTPTCSATATSCRRDLAATGYKPEYWKPEDSALIFCLLNFSQSANLPEEIASLVLAQTVTTDKLAVADPVRP